MFHRFTLFQQHSVQTVSTIDALLRPRAINLAMVEFEQMGDATVRQWSWQSEVAANDLLKHSVGALLHPMREQGELDYTMQTSATPIPEIKLAVFDMDSTLIQAEVMDELAYAVGIGPKVAAITASAMAGEIDFRQSFEQRLALLEGFDIDQLDAIYHTIELMPGAEKLMQQLQAKGIYCAILSGGFSYFADRLAQRLGMQQAFSNPLEQHEGKLTGQISVPILDANQKVTLLEQLRTELGLSMGQCLAVGDGANDLPMLNSAGLGVAFHAKLLVKQQAPQQISHFDLDVLACLV
jgi:phosphoserine phosphatase